MSGESERRPVGLKAITSAREERARSKTGRVSGKTWLAGGAALVATMVIAYLFSDRSLSTDKEKLLAEQRAAVVTVGAEWFPLRDKLEAITLGAAKDYKGDLVDPEAQKGDFRNLPGIYLRMRVDAAKDTKTLREHAAESLRDAFTACLMKPAPIDADGGGGVGGQPWNLRQAYQSTRVLEDVWANEVRESTDKLRLRVFEQQYEKAKRDEIPLAIDIVKRASIYLLVLDEDVPEAREYAGDAGKIDEEALQQVAHPARVVVVDLKSGAEIVRIRRSSSAGFVFAGEHAVQDPETLAAMRRQVNNCALANDVWAAIHPQ